MQYSWMLEFTVRRMNGNVCMGIVPEWKFNLKGQYITMDRGPGIVQYKLGCFFYDRPAKSIDAFKWYKSLGQADNFVSWNGVEMVALNKKLYKYCMKHCSSKVKNNVTKVRNDYKSRTKKS